MNDVEIKIEDFVLAGKAIYGFTKRIIRLVTTYRYFPNLYLTFSLIMLFSTTLLWSILGGRLQNFNADQLSNAYLFKNLTVFHAAFMPDQHSFLIKWPIFWLIKVYGYKPDTFIVFTSILALLTVGGLAYLIYRIEKRKTIFATLCLALASVLLLIPSSAYAGGLLPANLAMITTRNIEYIVYVFSIILVLHNAKQRGRNFWLGLTLLAVLIASDKLFLTLSIASGVISAFFYALLKRKQLFIKAIRWLSVSIGASALAVFSLWVINARFTNITSIGSSIAGPYGFVTSLHKIVIGSVYAVMSIFTNFGANPAYDSLNIREIPHTTLSRLSGIESISYMVNGLILVTAVFAIGLLLRKVIDHRIAEEFLSNSERITTLTLIWTSFAAIGAFIFTDHYYPVDARYLGIALFAGFLALAIMLRSYKFSRRHVLPIGLVLITSIFIGIPYCISTYHVQSHALAQIKDRNKTVSQILLNHHVTTLVGDYWRVLPIKLISNNKIDVSPLYSCTKEMVFLNSQVNHVNLDKSFAYLLTFDGSLTNYSKCSLDNIFKAYGKPNSSVVIEGKQKNPKELLLFYDRGANKSAPSVIVNSISTVLPISINRLPNRACLKNTSMNIVAHQDDDLLFMNPDILHDIQAGNCVRTVYLTAGDAGNDKLYWLNRQNGVEIAYSYLNNTPKDLWIERIVEVSKGKFITVANPRNNSKISLIFMHLPDGNLSGQGFKNYGFESLRNLYVGKVPVLHTVDGQSSYDLLQLTTTLTTLMNTYNINEIRTLADYVSKPFPDHSDHITAGNIASISFSNYLKLDNNMAKITFYIGYPIQKLPVNVNGEDLIKKQTAFFMYSKYDGGQCLSETQCEKTKSYLSYLSREYQNPN